MSPRGSAINMAPKATRNVPVTRGRMPKCLEEYKGVHLVSVKNSNMLTFWKKREASNIITETIATVVMIDIAETRSNITLIICSKIPALQRLLE